MKKEFDFLYRYGTYAPGTHLIPMSISAIEPVEELFKGLPLKYSVCSGPMPGTATISEKIDFFPCHQDVLPLMMKHFGYPDFFITLLQDTATLNIKCNYSKKPSYQIIPLQHTKGHCSAGVGHPHIHVLTDKGSSGVSRFQQLEWDTFEFEEDKINIYEFDINAQRYIDFT